MLSHLVAVRRSDLRIRAIDIFRASSRPPNKVYNIKQEFKRKFDRDYDPPYKGTYVDFWVGVELCRRYGLIELRKELRSREGIPQEPVKASDLAESVKVSKIPGFFEITDFPRPVMVQMSDIRINAFPHCQAHRSFKGDSIEIPK